MREIKFRAWDKLNQQMIPDMENWLDFGGVYWTNPEKTFDTPNQEIYTPVSQPIIMQFTGLKDRNGKEIYEGDIVNYAIKEKWCKNPKCQETKHRLYVDKFCPSCGTKVEDEDFVRTVEIRFKEGGFCLYEERASDDGIIYQAWQTYIAETYIQWKEVKGNVYQNAELLKPLSL